MIKKNGLPHKGKKVVFISRKVIIGPIMSVDIFIYLGTIIIMGMKVLILKIQIWVSERERGIDLIWERIIVSSKMAYQIIVIILVILEWIWKRFKANKVYIIIKQGWKTNTCLI